MDLSFNKTGIDESERAETQEQLLNGQPLFVEIDEIVSANTISGVLVLPAFGAPIDTKVHVRQVRTQSPYDSITRHIEGSDRVPALRKGDIVAFDRVFLAGGDAMAAQISARTHDGMRGRVQFLTGMARASATTVSERGAQQTLTVVDGSQAWRADNAEDIKAVYEKVLEMPWTGGKGGFVARMADGYTMEYHVTKEYSLAAFIDEVEARGYLEGQGWIELIPARKFPVGQDQVARDVNVRKIAPRTVGRVGSKYLPEKGGYPAFRRSAVILADEEEWAFGGKTGKLVRAAVGIQPLGREPVVGLRFIPTRTFDKPSKVFPVEQLYSDTAMDRMLAERVERRPRDHQAPVKPNSSHYSGRSNGTTADADERDTRSTPSSSAMPFSF